MAISVAFTDIADSAVDPDSPIDTQLMTALRNNAQHLREWLGADFVAGADRNHNHDGVNSALIETGTNLLRNGSFESGGGAGWTLSPYTGGTVATNASNNVAGLVAMAFTSSEVSNGGGEAQHNGYVSIAGGVSYLLSALVMASVAGVSARYEIIWYDEDQNQISADDVYASASVPTSWVQAARAMRAPDSARFARVRFIGGEPGVGSSAGTIYADDFQMAALTAGAPLRVQTFTSSGSWTRGRDVRWVFVEVQGGGGGGDTDTPGGSGGYAAKIIYAADLGATETVTVGAGGLSGAAGGTSSFGSHCSATGGDGGVGSGGTGAGGTGIGGDVNIDGNFGGASRASPRFGGAAAGDGAPGSGAGGATDGDIGGSGRVIVWEFG